jgi:hypothetical protein
MWERDGRSVGTMSVIRCTCWDGGARKAILRKSDGAEISFSQDEWNALVTYARSGEPEMATTISPDGR